MKRIWGTRSDTRGKHHKIMTITLYEKGSSNCRVGKYATTGGVPQDRTRDLLHIATVTSRGWKLCGSCILSGTYVLLCKSYDGTNPDTFDT
jgi:hypothetical protein